jgi:hypothetical protein
MQAYVGCKLEWHYKEERCIEFTQPVLLKSYMDEFNLQDKIKL